MTTQESLLALAKAVYPDADWVSHPDYVVASMRTAPGSDFMPGTLFNPTNNDAQAMEVLCWLLANGYANLSAAGLTWATRMFGTGYENHDSTPASLRSAIVQAACRVVAK